MDTCLMCGKKVAQYPGYVTEGTICICNECADANSLTRIMTRIENLGINSVLKSVFSMPIETDAGLVNQTEEFQLSTDYAGLVNQTTDVINVTDIKRRVDGVYDVCRVLWESSHDKKAVRDKYSELAGRLVEETDFSMGELGLPDPPYIRSDGTIGEVPASILSGGGSPTDEECELVDDIMIMSQDDFYSKYADNVAALNEWHDYHGEPQETIV